MKTVRFTQVVARSGKPEPHTLWTAPEEDRELQSALRQHRVMTVHQETTGQKKDYGEIGFTGDRKSSLLLFPKSLKAFAGSRVVGVKYDLLEAPAAPPTRSAPKVKEAPKPAPAAKAERPLKPRHAPAPKAELEAPARAPLRIFHPEDEKASPVVPPPEAAVLLRAIRRALKQLQSGKAVAAYETLQKAMQPAK